jgi:hypothetical protein
VLFINKIRDYNWGVLNLGGEKITLSNNNCLPLEDG